MGASMARQHPQREEQQGEGVIDRFTNEDGQEWLDEWGFLGFLTYTGGIVGGKAEGRGTVRCNSSFLFTIRDAEFLSGRMLPCRAIFSYDDPGDAFYGPLAACGLPADGARGAFVRAADGGRFQGRWAALGKGNDWAYPLEGAAWVADGGRVYAVALDGEEDISSAAGDGWRPGAHAGWRLLGVMERPAAGQVPLLRSKRAGLGA
jgi:hypothetical protein